MNVDIFHTLFTSPKLPVHLKQLSSMCAMKGEKITVLAYQKYSSCLPDSNILKHNALPRFFFLIFNKNEMLSFNLEQSSFKSPLLTDCRLADNFSFYCGTLKNVVTQVLF